MKTEATSTMRPIPMLKTNEGPKFDLTFKIGYNKKVDCKPGSATASFLASRIM